MTCDAVRAALVAERPFTADERDHAGTCAACGALVGWSPRPVLTRPPRPDPATWRARARRRTAAVGLLAAGAVFALFAARAALFVPPAPVAATAAPAAALFDSDGAPLAPAALARVELGGRLLDSPLDPVDPLDGLADPTDLFAEALLGTGAP